MPAGLDLRKCVDIKRATDGKNVQRMTLHTASWHYLQRSSSLKPSQNSQSFKYSGNKRAAALYFTGTHRSQQITSPLFVSGTIRNVVQRQEVIHLTVDAVAKHVVTRVGSVVKHTFYHVQDLTRKCFAAFDAQKIMMYDEMFVIASKLHVPTPHVSPFHSNFTGYTPITRIITTYASRI